MALAVAEDERGVVGAILVAGGAQAIAERDLAAVRQLAHAGEAERAQLVAEARAHEAADEDLGRARQPAQRRLVEVIDVLVRQVDVVDVREIGGVRGRAGNCHQAPR